MSLATFGLFACGDSVDGDDSNNADQPEAPASYQLEAVDLGLSVKWANMNVGASTPWDFGSYFAWGEYNVKDTYTAENYQGPTNRSNIAGSAFDAASWAFGLPWGMPSEAEIKELIDNCTYEWTEMNGVKGGKFTASNGNSIFLPAAGWKLDRLYKGNEEGGYWAGTGGGKCGLFMSGSFMRAYSNWTATTGMPVRAILK